MRRNRGGWPLRVKTVFDAAALRRAARTSDRLHNAIMYIHSTVDASEETPYGGLYDAVTGKGDKGSSDALDVLADAVRRVSKEAAERNEAAKAAQGGRS